VRQVKSLWLAAVCGVALCAGVQAKEFDKSGSVIAEREVNWPLPWRLGTRLEYDEVDETVTIQGDRESRSTSTAVATVEILQVREEGFLQRWSWRDAGAQHEGVDEAVRRFTAAAMKGLEDLPLDVRLDKDGAYVAIDNIQTLSTKAREAMHRAAKESMAEGKRPLSAKEQQGLLRMLDAMTTPAALENMIASVPSRYNFVSSGGLTPGRLYEYEDEGPNPFGGAAFPMHDTILLEPDTTPGWYLLQWTMTMDREKGSEVLADAVEHILKSGAPKMSKAEFDAVRERVLKDTDVNFSARFRVDGRTGVVQWMQLVQAKRVGGRNTVQTSTLTLRD
jgi:hypothetical protein